MDLLIAKSRNRVVGRPMVMHGLRGVGKTVLLNKFRSMANEAGWLTVDLEGARTDSGTAAFRNRLARGLAAGSRRLSRSPEWPRELADALGTIKSFTVNLGVVSATLDAAPTHGRADSGEIEVDLGELVEDLAPLLRKRSTAFAVFIDEMQDVDPALMSALIAVQHKAGQDDVPFYVVGAGLPSLPSVLSDQRSYAERLFDYRVIGSLDPVEAAEALVEPARRHGASFAEEAQSAVVDASGGYPYFIQTFGDKVWTNAADRRITVEDARAGLDDGWAALDEGFYPARWDRATPSERRYLRAMADDEDAPSRTSAVATRLGQTLTQLSQARQSLINKGIVYSPERGLIAFTVPGMAAFIRRQHAE